ncbi:SH3 domain-containing protein [Streptococcus oricebi]|uniref:N-acetylmuramoyl-L-alanine amidase n=1 Tax=Streptococcus oricebi TaxID=1547447 RepID=A0ABS5B145_9STRE|nr:SH3 domain-containing protein [Streptococcus oricebi]MBP2622544.1 amidase [Streptococcus oricebi]
MKIFKKLLVGGSLLVGTTVISTSFLEAAVLGDDYPLLWRQAPADSLVDSWNMYNRECTSFVAFRLSSSNHFDLPLGYGNAHTWGRIAAGGGYQVDKNPAVGSVAWFDSFVGYAGSMGHVAWVAEVRGDEVELEEYNYNAGQGPHLYHRRRVPKTLVSGFIHFRDLVAGEEAGAPLASLSGLASQGHYQFSQRSPVRANPSLASPELAVYQAGDQVVYDQVLTREGQEWISYIATSGQRRYIAIGDSATAGKEEFRIGDRVAFPEVYQVSSHLLGGVTSHALAGGQPTTLNVLDPGPLLETDSQGQISGDQVLQPGDYFTLPGTYEVLGLDQATNAIYLKIGNRYVWLDQGQAQKKG